VLRLLPLLFLSLLFSRVSANGGQAFSDTAGQAKVRKHSPKLAGTLSAVIPGAGQLYNAKYWKLPLVYGALGGIAYLVTDNNRIYKNYRDVIRFRTGNNPDGIDLYPDYSTEQLVLLQDQARRNRDLFIIGGTLVYMLQIVDAIVDAHLKTFDVSDDLSVVPVLLPANNRNLAGFSLVWRF